MVALSGGRTPFQTLTFSARIADGIATIDEGTAEGSDARVSVTGHADLGHRGLMLQAIAAAPTPSTVAIGFDVSGTFDKVLVAPELSSAKPAP